MTSRIVQEVEGHAHHVTSQCFIENGKWFLTFSMDEDDAGIGPKLGGGLSSIKESVFLGK